MSVLLLLAGAACERVNPGFKLKDTSDDQGEVTSLSTSSVSGPTVTGDTGMTTTPTTSDDVTTIEATLTDPTTTTGTPTSDTETTVDPTTGMMQPWDDDCGPDETETVEFMLLADTFFMYADESVGPGCDIGGGEGIQGNFCFNLAFGKSDFQQVFHYVVDGFDDPFSVFAVAFKPQTLNDGIDDVPPQAIVGLTLSFAFARIDGGDSERSFELLRMNPKDQWMEGNNLEAEVCGTNDPSYRCRGCIDGNAEAPCALAWESGKPFDEQSVKVHEFAVGAADFMKPVAIVLPESELEALKGPHAGFVVFPKLGLKDGIFEIKTREFAPATAPKLVARYCRDPNKP